jgi:tetratricopeptide (TPR) repeat protein
MRNWWLFAGIALLLAGAGAAGLVWTDVWRLGPTDAERAQSRTLFVQAQTQLQSGNQDAALHALTVSIRLAPQDDALRARASIYLARRDFNGAMHDVDAVLAHGRAVAGDYSLRCWLLARNAELSRALADCDRAIEMDPALASAFGSRGLVNLKQGRNQEAWNDFNTALRVGGSGDGVAWRLFGRGVAAWGLGRTVEGRQDIELALHGSPGVAADFAQFGVGGEIVRQFDDATYAAAADPRSLIGLRQYLYVYPSGAHAAEAQAQIQAIYAWIAEDEAAGRRRFPGFSFAQERGSGPASDSFGAIAISRSTWRVAFVTDYASDTEAERAAARVCNAASVRDCEAFAFRNVCAALAISPAERTRGMAWAYGEDDAVRGSISACRARGGSACVPVHSQCTPTPPAETPTPVSSP